MKKSYLSQQVKLMTLTTTDLFTDEEYALYLRIVNLINETERLAAEAKKNHCKVDADEKAKLLAERKTLQAELDSLILQHSGTPRTVRLDSVLDSRIEEALRSATGRSLPRGASWTTLRNSRKIAEFMSDMARTLGLHPDDVTFDKIIVKWKSQDILHQIVLDGFYLPLLHVDSGEVEMRHFQFVTASAGQLRTDRTVFMSDDAWTRIHDHVFCGLSEEIINQHSGLNIS